MKIKEQLLYLENESIISPSTILTIRTDQSDVYLIGLFTLSKDMSLTVDFVKQNDSTFKGRLNIPLEILPLMTFCKLKIIVSSGLMSYTSNSVDISYDIQKIKLKATAGYANEVQDLKFKMLRLDRTFQEILSGRLIDTFNLCNKTTLKQGMIPVCVDSKGNFIGAFPFNDTIKVLNGKTPIAGELTLEASDIPLNSTVKVNEAMELLQEKINTISSLLETLSQNQIAINNQIAEVALALAEHTTSGVI